MRYYLKPCYCIHMINLNGFAQFVVEVIKLLFDSSSFKTYSVIYF
jgi:hypothetical protein